MSKFSKLTKNPARKAIIAEAIDDTMRNKVDPPCDLKRAFDFLIAIYEFDPVKGACLDQEQVDLLNDFRADGLVQNIAIRENFLRRAQITNKGVLAIREWQRILLGIPTHEQKYYAHLSKRSLQSFFVFSAAVLLIWLTILRASLRTFLLSRKSLISLIISSKASGFSFVSDNFIFSITAFLALVPKMLGPTRNLQQDSSLRCKLLNAKPIRVRTELGCYKKCCIKLTR
jgi:hypothetical protein